MNRHPEYDEADGDELGQAWKPIGYALGPIAEKMGWRVEYAAICESPIEIDLAVAIRSSIGEWLQRCGLEFRPQFPWQNYRIDFAVTHGGKPIMFIECDGREFHSSERQVERDLLKDERVFLAGITMARFTGSEIFRSPDDCVHRVVNYLRVRGFA